MKRILKLAILITTVTFIISSCGTKEIEENVTQNYDNVNKMLKELKSFASSADITYVSNKEEVTYKILQYSNADGKYRVEVVSPESVAGNLSMFDGKTVFQKSNNSDEIIVTATDDMERSQIFLTNFLKNYSSSEEISVSVGDFNNSTTTVLEAIIPGEHPYMATEKLWVDNETLLPKKLTIYDYDNKERIVVVYDQFVTNPVLSDKIFTLVE